MVNEFEKKLNDEFNLANNYQPKDADWLQGNWKHIKNSEDKNIKTAIDKKTIKNLIDKIVKDDLSKEDLEVIKDQYLDMTTENDRAFYQYLLGNIID